IGLAAPDSVRIEATVPFGEPAFILTARDGEATLLLPRDNRVLERGRPDAVLEAVAGVPLDPSGLRAALTGCIGADASGGAQQVGDGWIVLSTPSGHAYLTREKSAAWQLVAETHEAGSPREWRAEYHDFRAGLPQTIRLAAADRSRFDLALALSDT